MKKITQTEFNNLEFFTALRAVSKWYKVFEGLAVGEGVIIDKKEWGLKTSPSVYSRNFKKKKMFIMKCRQLKDKSSWAV